MHFLLRNKSTASNEDMTLTPGKTGSRVGGYFFVFSDLDAYDQFEFTAPSLSMAKLSSLLSAFFVDPNVWRVFRPLYP